MDLEIWKTIRTLSEKGRAYIENEKRNNNEKKSSSEQINHLIETQISNQRRMKKLLEQQLNQTEELMKKLFGEQFKHNSGKTEKHLEEQLIDNQNRMRILIQELVKNKEKQLQTNNEGKTGTVEEPKEHETFRTIDRSNMNKNEPTIENYRTINDSISKKIVDPRNNSFHIEREKNNNVTSIPQRHEEENIESKQNTGIQDEQKTYFSTNDTEKNSIADLTTEEKKKLQNRRCTIKQREKNYRYEIVLRNINPSLKIIEMKHMLRNWKIEFTAINASTNETNGQRSLFIGMKSEEDVKKYWSKTEWLFRNEN